MNKTTKENLDTRGIVLMSFAGRLKKRGFDKQTIITVTHLRNDEFSIPLSEDDIHDILDVVLP